MAKSVYSLVLRDEVVAEIDRLAYRMNTNRSNMINQILAEYVHQCDYPSGNLSLRGPGAPAGSHPARSYRQLCRKPDSHSAGTILQYKMDAGISPEQTSEHAYQETTTSGGLRSRRKAPVPHESPGILPAAAGNIHLKSDFVSEQPERRLKRKSGRPGTFSHCCGSLCLLCTFPVFRQSPG